MQTYWVHEDLLSTQSRQQQQDILTTVPSWAWWKGRLCFIIIQTPRIIKTEMFQFLKLYMNRIKRRSVWILKSAMKYLRVLFSSPVTKSYFRNRRQLEVLRKWGVVCSKTPKSKSHRKTKDDVGWVSILENNLSLLIHNNFEEVFITNLIVFSAQVLCDLKKS